MELKRENYCPLLKKECVGLKCSWFIKVEGYDMNTGKRVDDWNCAISWLPMLLIENSGQQRQTGAAVESFRNEMVKSNEAARELLIATVQGQLPNIVQGESKLINLEDKDGNN